MERVDPLTIPTVQRRAEETFAFLILGRALVIAPFVSTRDPDAALCFARSPCAFKLLLAMSGCSRSACVVFGLGELSVCLLRQGLGLPAGTGDPDRRRNRRCARYHFRHAAISPSGHLFAMVTLALAQMMFLFALQAKFTGAGRHPIRAARQAVRPVQSRRPVTMYVFVWSSSSRSSVIHRVINSPFGEVSSDRENDHARSRRYKTIATNSSRRALCGRARRTKLGQIDTH